MDRKLEKAWILWSLLSFQVPHNNQEKTNITHSTWENSQMLALRDERIRSLWTQAWWEFAILGAVFFGDCQGSLNQPCGGIKQYNFMVKLRDVPYNGALFELVM